MSLVDELQKLEQLRHHGSLTADEFAQAKAQLLAKPADESLEQLSEQLTEVRSHNQLARLNREWEIERQQYLITTRYGRQVVPTQTMGFVTAVFGGLFGLFWTAMAVSMTNNAPDFGAFSIAKFAFPLFGVLFIVLAIGWGVYCYNKATQYEQALQNYQARRKVSGE
jgi:hypothetical protein